MSPITPAVVTVILAAAYFGYRAINAHADEAEAKSAVVKHRKTLTEAKEKAAKGDPAAMALIGLAYHAGAGVKQNFREAYFWLLAAQKCGAQEAEGKSIEACINESGRMLVEAERNDVEQRVESWAPGPGTTDGIVLKDDPAPAAAR